MLVAVMPTVHGETVVLRLLRPDTVVKPLDEIAADGADSRILRALCGLPSGLVLVTGAPGSGKSTLLYSMVNEIDRKTRSVVSVEDPIVFGLEDVQQIAVNHKVGMTYALALRSALRLDPDVIVVGELRDAETAEVALAAAATGHLVIGTMHTPTPAETVTRLVEMGLPAYGLNSALAGVVSQRLVRKLCPKCRAETKAPGEGAPEEAAEIIRGLENATLFSPVGCEECNGGYKGRAAIQEVLVPDEGFRRALSSGADRAGLREAATAAGTVTALRRGLELAAKGVTSVDEVLRVTRDPRPLVR
jgi:type II secretory ATPase GspE/PulE/Tfp pilus assembly ATPase PilB-like protein